MSIDWQKLRSFDGSQYAAFEELCCQLAASESVPLNSQFFRIGAPDAGVECFWKLPSNDEWGWQAKFFLEPPDNAQWKQIDKSVDTALKKHPKLTRYIICLPIDRQDPRIENQRWFMDKWNERVKKWTSQAAESGMSVSFEYWGSHEIFERLSREEHRGRQYFWFNEEMFSQQWFQDRIDQAVADVGPRYSPQLDVELPIAQIFDGLGRTRATSDRINSLYVKTCKAVPKSIESRVGSQAAELDKSMDVIGKLLSDVKPENPKPIDWEKTVLLIRAAMNLAHECAAMLNSLEEEQKQAEMSEEQRRIRSMASEYQRLYLALLKLSRYLDSDEIRLMNPASLLLVAEAGKGKTHLFCDVASRRSEANLPTVLLIGTQFNYDRPWAQILQQLGLSCTQEEFLGALEAAAQARGRKALILIDALNEGQDKALWRNHLAGMLTVLSKYPWLSIGVNVRTSYEELTIPEGLVPDKLVRVEHRGFAGHEYRATKSFFDYYKIQYPSVPLLAPEFQNPLFLKVFCQALSNSGMTRIPPGLQGVTAIFKFFVDSVDKKLSTPERLDFNPNLGIVWRAVGSFAEGLTRTDRSWLLTETAQAIINSALPRTGYENSLFRQLLAEGIIAENRFYRDDGSQVEGVHFAYERFTDHLVAKHHLDVHLDVDSLASSFGADAPLTALIESAAEHGRSGLLEAFSVQLPELLQQELADLVPTVAASWFAIGAFVDSLIWRDPEAFSEMTLSYINKYIVHNDYYHDRFLNTLLTVAINPDHPYNADFLHKQLLRRPLAERDAWWSVFLDDQYGSQDAVDRLVDWAWTQDDKSHIGGDSIRLCGVALSWFLCSSNRTLRDGTTKALICLFTSRMNVLADVLTTFDGVDDPYITERLMAVAYGCAMRGEDDQNLVLLADRVYKLIFEEGEPPVHILTRDYARGVIEVALARNLRVDVEESKIRPPYNSRFPENIPTEEEIKTKYYTAEDEKRDVDYAQSYLWSSVMGFGDFARYIIGTNSSRFAWSSWRLNEPREPSPKELHEAFTASLTERQSKAFEAYKTVRDNVALYRQLGKEERRETFEFDDDLTEEELDKVLLHYETKFRKTLGKKKLVTFTDKVVGHMDSLREDEFRYQDEHRFDLSLAQRFVMNRVFELGWTVERFGPHDRSITISHAGDRLGSSRERIGKKYQWIAYHEFLARVADNFVFTPGYRDTPDGIPYDGTWQELFVRDIDPSWTLPEVKKVGWYEAFEPTWWAPASFAWDGIVDMSEWIRSTEDLPSVEAMLDVVNPEENSSWLVLDMASRWDGRVENVSESKHPYPSTWYKVNSYVVKKDDVCDVYEQIKANWPALPKLPTTYEKYHTFLGEFYWSDAFKYASSLAAEEDGQTANEDGWIEAGDGVPAPTLLTSDEYALESDGKDYSITERLGVCLPCKWLVHSMALFWRGKEGRYFDEAGRLIAYDPSVESVGPGALLIRREPFLRHLDVNGYTLLWVVRGEKLVITGEGPRPGNWQGRLLIQGVYTMTDGSIVGEIQSTHTP